MFSRDFQIWGSALIAWTMLFFIYPMIGMFIMGLGCSALFFFLALNGIRDGVISGRFKIRFERSREPGFFWFCISFIVLCGIVMIGMMVIGIYERRADLLVHYF